MSRDHRRWDRFTVILVSITLAGLVWRVAYVVWLRNRGVLGDGYVFHTGALESRRGHRVLRPGVGRGDCRSSPRVAGRARRAQRPRVEVVAFAPVVHVPRRDRHCFHEWARGPCRVGRRVGLIAAALAAVYPFVWVYEREVLSEPLAMLGTATAIWLAYRFRARPGPGFAIALGAAAGALAMTRSELIAVSVLLVLPLVLSARDVELRRRLVWLVLAGIACVVVIAPWAVYNSTRFEKQVPFSTGLGVAMLTGNCAPVYHGSMIGYANLGCVAFVPHVSSDYSVADGQYRHQALKFIGKHKSQAAIVAFGAAWAGHLGSSGPFSRCTSRRRIATARSGCSAWASPCTG